MTIYEQLRPLFFSWEVFSVMLQTIFPIKKIMGKAALVWSYLDSPLLIIDQKC